VVNVLLLGGIGLPPGPAGSDARPMARLNEALISTQVPPSSPFGAG